MNTTDDVIGILDRRIKTLELKLEVLTAMLDGRAETDTQWRNSVESRLDRLNEPAPWWPNWAKTQEGRIG